MVRPRTRTLVALIVGLAILAGLIVYAGPASILHAFATASPTFLLFAFLAYAAFFVLRGIRWGLLLGDVAPRAPVASTAGYSAMGWLINTYVPLKAGDAVRAALFARRRRVGFLPVAGSIAVERALDLMALAALATLGLFLASRHAPLPPLVAQAVAVAWFLPILGLLLLILVARATGTRAHRNRFLRAADQVLQASRDLARTPRRIPALALATLLVAVAQAAVFVFLFLAFAPHAPLVPVLAGVPLFLLTFIIALTPGNVGTYEAGFVAAFALMGFAVDALIPMAVAIHVLTTLYVTILGAIGFAAANRVPHPLRQPNPLEETAPCP